MTKFIMPLAVALVSVTFLTNSSLANEKPIQIQVKPINVQNAPNNVVPAPTIHSAPAVTPQAMPQPSIAPSHATPAKEQGASNEHTAPTEVNFANFTKPDTALADEIVESFNKKDLALFEKTLSKTGFTIISPFDGEANSSDLLKSLWHEMFNERGCFKSSNFTAVHGTIQAPYPGVATLITKLKFLNEGKEVHGLLDLTMKYEAEGWKIVALHFSSYDMVKHMTTSEVRKMAEYEYRHHQSKQMGLFLPFVFGLVLGSAITFAYQRSKKKDRR